MLPHPPMREAAATAWVAAAAIAVPCIITVRGSRSPRTPPNSTASTSASA
jgi:hypothetical protein